MDIFIVYACGLFFCLINGRKLHSEEGDYEFKPNFDDGEGSNSVEAVFVFNLVNNSSADQLSSNKSKSANDHFKDFTLFYLSRFTNYSIDGQLNEKNSSDTPKTIAGEAMQSFINSILSMNRLLDGKNIYNLSARNFQGTAQTSISNITRNSSSSDITLISKNTSYFTKISRRSTGYGVYDSNMGQYAQQNSYSGQSGGYSSYGRGQQSGYGNQQNGNNAYGGQGNGYGNNGYQPQNGGYGSSAQGGTYGYFGQNTGYGNNGYTGGSGYNSGGTDIFSSGFFFGTPFGSGTDPFKEWIAAFDAGYDAGVNSISGSSDDKKENKDKDKDKNDNKEKDENNNDNGNDEANVVNNNNDGGNDEN